MKRLLKLAISLMVRAGDVCAAAVLRSAGRRPSPTCVVLYYHGVNSAQRERFARQMDELLRLSRPIAAGLQPSFNGTLHRTTVTFDDGFVSVVENAVPELQQRHIPATLFVPTGSLGARPGWIPQSNEQVVSAAALKGLAETGLVTIGSHSVSHPNFLKLEEAQAERELRQSKADLEAILGRSVTLFSFPHGACNQRLIALAKASGYEHVFTIQPECLPAATSAFARGRVSVGPNDWPLEFRLKLLGAYRWLARRKGKKAENRKQKTEAES